ncbi:MAG: 3-keto-5-aminohexanoate cleavage protein [Anaerovoracaceae bacterium]
MEKLIINASICGATVKKEQNPAVPYTIEELAREAKSAYEAGASIIHLHVRRDDGSPTQDRDRFQEAVDAILAVCPDVIIQPSTSGESGMSDMERLSSLNIVPKPEIAPITCGTPNMGGNNIFVNTNDTIFNFAKIMKEKGIKPELEVFDKGMIDIAAKADKLGLFEHPLHFNLLLGIQMGATLRDLVFLVDSLPPGSTWAATSAGSKTTMAIASAAIVMGGHIRIGFEDTIYIEKGVLAESNGQLVEKIVKLARLLGRDVATPDEARRILSLR